MLPDIPFSDDDARAIMAVARPLVLSTGDEIHRLAASLRGQTSKGGVDVVTEADGLSERLLADGLSAAFPDHRVAGEEGTRRGPADSPWTWHIDPLDGTANFSRGLPYWMVSVGLAWKDTPVLGILHGPACGLTLWGGHGIGVFHDDRALPLATPPPPPNQTIVAADWPWKLEERRRTNRLLDHLAGTIRQYKTYGSAAVDLAHVALGRVDAYCISHIFPWDQCGGAALCAALGHDLRRWDGSPWDLRHPDIVVCRPGLWPLLAPGLT